MSVSQDFLGTLAEMVLKVVLVPLVFLVTQERWGNQVAIPKPPTPQNNLQLCRHF